ncbi:hypothetical protein G3I32_39405 [Streptomyces coelicoflavus]|uniref:Uncharacterized protein n=1 Tax=Streptomyces coelicoflavus TaxID=285562 RepID=A0A7K3PXV0_9ACTN|nr:hypothetical protein [Streptomyces coelicoflavus]NEB14822.1 hypothetical protein [Streptomyces coelicoflavus]
MSAPSYKRTDSNGTFTGRVNMAGTVGKPAHMAWSFRTSPKVQGARGEASAAAEATAYASDLDIAYDF